MHVNKSKKIIIVGFTTLILVIVAVTVAGFSRMVSINKQLEGLTNEQIKKTDLTYSMRLTARERMISLILIANLSDPFEQDEEIVRFNSLGAQFADARIQLHALPLDSQEQTLLTEQGKATAKVKPLQDTLIDYAFMSKKEIAHKYLVEKVLPAQDEVINKLKDLHEIQDKLHKSKLQSAVISYRTAYIMFMAILSIGTLIVGIIIALMVIRKISHIEDALFKEQERYALAVRGANDGVWDWDLENNTIYFSPRWKDMLGYDDHEIQNKADEWLKRIHPDDSENTMSKLTAHLNGHSYYFESEHRLQHKNGKYRWFLERGLASRDETGKAYRIAGSQTDITTHKEFEQKLEQSESRIWSVLENVSEAVVTINSYGKIESVNIAALNLFGYNADEMTDRKFVDLISEPFRNEYNKQFQDLEQDETKNLGITYKISGIRKNNQNFPLEIMISDIWIDKRQKFIIIARDISNQKSKLSA